MARPGLVRQGGARLGLVRQGAVTVPDTAVAALRPGLPRYGTVGCGPARIGKERSGYLIRPAAR